MKNNLAAKASEGTPASDLLGDLKGMTSLAYTAKDPVALAKALTKYSKENAQFTFKAGMVEGRVIDIKAIGDLASMPPKEEIYAKLLYLINATATRLVTSINGVGRNLAVVLDQATKEGKFHSNFWAGDPPVGNQKVFSGSERQWRTLTQSQNRSRA